MIFFYYMCGLKSPVDFRGTYFLPVDLLFQINTSSKKNKKGNLVKLMNLVQD